LKRNENFTKKLRIKRKRKGPKPKKLKQIKQTYNLRGNTKRKENKVPLITNISTTNYMRRTMRKITLWHI
jgi:hypothetical protein